MGRPLRSSVGGVVYHVLNRRVLRLELFEDAADYLAFVKVLADALERNAQDVANAPGPPALFSFCLMPNHWHLLLRPKADGDLSRWMQWLTVTHTHRWHQHHRTVGTGPVYQGRFKAFPVQEDEHFYTVARYVERNPLRAGLVERSQDWRWSSLGLRQGAGLDLPERRLRDALSPWPIDMPRQWVRRVNQPEPQVELEALRRSAQKGRPFGQDQWVEATANTLGLESTLRDAGRPKKET